MGSGWSPWPRYELLETLRQYGRHRLREIDQEISIQARHRDWIAKLTALFGAFDSRQVELFHRIHLERDNVWAALDFCLRHEGEASKGAKICHDVWVHWGSRGPVTDALRIVTSLLEATPEDGLPRGQLLVAAAGLAITQWDFAAIAMHSEESLRIGRRINDPEIVATALMFQGLARMMAGDLIVALELAESALALAKAQQLRPVVLGVMRLICNIKRSTADLESVVKVGEEALQLCRASGEMWVRSYLLNDIAHAVWRRGDLRRAEALAQEEVSCHIALDDRQGLSMAAEMLAWMATERRVYQRAATLFGCAERLRESVGSTFPELFREQHERSVSAAKTGLGTAGFTAALDRGRAMTIDEFVSHALGEKRPASRPHIATGDSAVSLTRRELEIAHLIAEGPTSQQIAAKLFISERTVTTHVTNMLNKLGLGPRIQLASWVTASQSPSTRSTQSPTTFLRFPRRATSLD